MVMIPGSIESRKNELGISPKVLKSYDIKSASLPKTCSSQVLGIGDGGLGGFVQSCKLCGREESISNMLLCDCCDDAFHVSCCKLSVVFPIDDWYCQSCLKIMREMPHNNSLLKPPTITSRIDSLVPSAVLGIDDSHGGDIQSCKLCGHPESISNMLLCDCCDEAFHASCCNISVVLPIDEWYCHSCLAVIREVTQNIPVLKSPSNSLGIDSCGLESGPIAGLGMNDIQLCKLCGHSDNVSNMLLCDRCEEAFHVSCCKPKVVLPIDEWFCYSCSITIRRTSQNTSVQKSPSIISGIGSCKFELGPILGPIALMLKYPEPYTSKVRIGESFQADVPDWCDQNHQISMTPLSEVQSDEWDCSSVVLSDSSPSDCTDSQGGSSGSGIASGKRKREFPSQMVPNPQ